MPIAFLCGYHGFAIFAPYLLVVLLGFELYRRRRALAPVPAVVRPPLPVA
jgi:hypothetical protein